MHSTKLFKQCVNAAVLLGCAALVGMLVVVVLSVVGRHIEIPLPGSVEIVEMLIVVVASTSLLVATYQGTHAAARLFIDRLTPQLKSVVEKTGLLFGATFTFALLAGNTWLIVDYWSTREATHLLGIPVIPFRVLLCFSLAAVSGVLLHKLFKRQNGSAPAEPRQ